MAGSLGGHMRHNSEDQADLGMATTSMNNAYIHRLAPITMAPNRLAAAAHRQHTPPAHAMPASAQTVYLMN